MHRTPDEAPKAPEPQVVTVKEVVVKEVHAREKHLDLPHISNLHEDPQLAGREKNTRKKIRSSFFEILVSVIQRKYLKAKTV
jgi:hypothetical protein